MDVLRQLKLVKVKSLGPRQKTSNFEEFQITWHSLKDNLKMFVATKN